MKKLILILCCLLSGLIGKSQGTWVQKADFPGGFRVNAVCFSVEGHGYIGGGFSPWIGPDLYDMWAYDPVSDSWDQLADLPVNLSYATVLTINDTAYFFTTADSGGIKTFECWKYFVQQDSLGLFSSYPASGNYDIVAGFTIQQKACLLIQHDPLLLFEFDPLYKTWVQKADFPLSGTLYDFTAFSALDRGYIFEGYNTVGNTNDLWEWNSSTDTWMQKASLPDTLRGNSASFSFNDKGFIFGGLISPWPFIPLSDFWKYNPLTDSWTELPNFGGWGRGYAASFVIGNYAFVGPGTGTGTVAFTDLWSFDLITGISDMEDGPNVLVFPNPAHNDIVFYLQDQPNESLNIQIFNSLGNLVKKGIWERNTSFRIDLKDTSPGLFFFQIFQGNRLYSTGKFIKE
ncbi:MAG: T9SS type A sorting domain-containing protein [Bacteroidetes bacterium]|nr:T9SS type A sorting domain-containing protein [Bacteroidota bacterium]